MSTNNNTPSTDAAAPVIVVQASVNSYLKKNATTLEAAFSLIPQNFESLVNTVVEQNIIFLGDVSTSMIQPPSKLTNMKVAIEAGIKLLPPHAFFAVVIFSDGAITVVPLQQATDKNKADAITKVRAINTIGGTVMSAGLAAVMTEHMKRPNASGEVIMLTDGANNDTDERLLAAQIGKYREAAQKGIFVRVHARGVNNDFVMKQVREIADGTKGRPPEYITAEETVRDFEEVITSVAGNRVSDVRLKVWCPNVVELKGCKRTMPDIRDLMPDRTTDRTSGQMHIFPMADMSEEMVEIFCVFGVQPKPVGQLASAGKVSLLYKLNGVEIETTPYVVKAEYTNEDDPRSTRIAPGVARAKGDQELADNINEGLAAQAKGDKQTATVKFGNAARIANEKGDVEMTKRLAAIVDIDDAATGTVRLKNNVDKGATLRLEAASVRTVRKTTKVTPDEAQK